MIVSREAFPDVVQRLRTPAERALDTECTGLRPYHEDELFSLIIMDDITPYYFNFLPYDGLGDEYVLPRSYLAKFHPVFGDPRSTWFLANAKYDMAMLAREGLSLEGEIHCVVALGRVERNDEMSYSLSSCAERIGLGKSDVVAEYVAKHHLWEWQTIPGKKKRVKKPFYNKVPFNLIVPYAEQDAVVTRAVALSQKKAFDEITNSTAEGLPPISRVVKLEKRFTKTAFNVEKAGIQIDPQYCQAALEFEEGRYFQAMEKFKELSGLEFKDANTLLAEAFRRAGEKIPLTENGNPSFTDEVLQGYTTPLAKIVQEYRDAYKKANSYYKNFLYYKDDKNRIHPNLKQGGTGTGRISCTDPALQTLIAEEEANLPFQVRRAFVPGPGKFLLMIDYDQMEYRMMLDYAGQMDVIEQVKAGMDVHDATAKKIGNISRSQAKTLNFGLLYGMGISALASSLKTSEENARSLKQNYFQALPYVHSFIRRVTARAESIGYITNWTGRRSYFKDLKFSYKACNYLIQGGCGDAVKKAMNRIDDLISGYESKMVMQVHDELLFEMPIKEAFLIEPIKSIMENAYPYRHLQLTCSVEHSFKSWADPIKGVPS